MIVEHVVKFFEGRMNVFIRMKRVGRNEVEKFKIHIDVRDARLK